MRPDEIAGIAFAVAWPPVFAAAWARILRLLADRPLGGFWGSWMTASIVTTFTLALGDNPPGAVTAAASTVFAVIMWWLSRRRRKRAPKLAGYKARALTAALVRKARKAVQPRPVLRPQPQGAS